MAKRISEAKATTKLEPDDNLDLREWFNPALFKTTILLRVLLVMLIMIAAFWLGAWAWLAFTYFAGLLLLFISAWLIALILTPLVRRLVIFGLPKGAAIGLAYLLVLLIIGAFAVLAGPGLVLQTSTLIQNFGPLTNDTANWLNTTTKKLGIGPLDLNEVSKQFQGYATTILRNALDVATGLAGFLIQILLVLIISGSLLAGQTYTEKDEQRRSKKHGWTEVVPQRWRTFANLLKQTLERNFGVFLGGQLIVGFIYGVMVGVAMSFAGLPYAVTTAVICGLMMLIPLFGGPLSLLLPLIVAISSEPAKAWIVLPILFVLQTVLLNVVLPKIIGQSSGLGPVATLFVLLAGAQIGGVWGVLLGVPVAGVVVSIWEYLVIGAARRQLEEAKTKSASDENLSAQVEITLVKTPLDTIPKS